MAEGRRIVLQSIINSAPVPDEMGDKYMVPKEFLNTFGSDVLTNSVLRTLIPESSFKALQRAINSPTQDIDHNIADQVANAMKEWALSKGKLKYALIILER